MKTKILFLVFVFYGVFGKCQKKKTEIKVLKIISVYDGDTFRADLDCETPIFCKNMSIRVLGVDTPEIRSKCPFEKQKALEAKKFTQNFLKKGKIVLKNIGKGKYFRIVADVFVGGKSLTKALIKNKLGFPYDGGTKKSWCP